MPFGKKADQVIKGIDTGLNVAGALSDSIKTNFPGVTDNKYFRAADNAAKLAQQGTQAYVNPGEVAPFEPTVPATPP